MERFPTPSDAEMPDAHEILLIDGSAEDLLSAAESVGGSEGVHLLAASSLAEGRRLLSRYGAVIDAVLVSGRLAEDAEATERMRAVFPRLPVIEFDLEEKTGAGTEQPDASESAAVPPPLGPNAVARALERALARARAALNGEDRRGELATSEEAGRASKYTEPLVLTEDAGGEEDACHFAFRLAKIAQARSEEEAARAVSVAQKWHRRLPGVLARYGSDVAFRLRYVTDPHAEEPTRRLRVALVVTVTGEGKSAERRARRIGSELGVHLAREAQPGGGPRGGAGVYHFRPVRSEEVLRRLLVPVLPRTAARFSPRALTAALPPAALILSGFDETDDLFLPEAVVLPADQSEENESSLHALCDLLLRQRSATTLELRLRPRVLPEQERRVLRALAVLLAPGEGQASDLVRRTRLAPSEERALARRAEALLSGCCFEANCYVAQEDGGPLPQPLQAAVADGFRGAGVRARPAHAEVRRGLLHLSTASEERGEEPLARVLSRSEAARFFRLPLPAESAAPGIEATHPLREFAPRGLAGEGPVLGARHAAGALEGHEQQRLVRLRPDDLRRHVHVLGQTGTGKTTLLLSMLKERMASGAGVGLIDPHGDLFGRVYDAVPKSRRKDVVLFDPADPRSTARLNLLEYDPERPQQKSVLIEELFDIFREDTREDWMGPIFQLYMRNACLLAMESREAPGTLLDVVKVFQDESHRDRLIEACPDPLVCDFWQKEADHVSGEVSIDNIAPYVTSKLNAFVYNDYLRRLIDAPKSNIDFREILDEGKILLAKLPKGELGAFGTRLIGTVLVARLLMAALSRENVPEEERRDFTLFMDEFQTFTSSHTASMLAEARKYRLGLVMANQSLGQLRDEVRSALGNAASRIFFRPVPEDYPHVAPYLSPPFERREITQLPNYTAAARLMIGGEPTDPFLFETIPPGETPAL